MNKTKHKGSNAIKVELCNKSYTSSKTGDRFTFFNPNYCIKVELEGGRRKYITLHINDNKIKILRRELAINMLLD